jgi:N-acetylmuramoyl-L-alanine amidase
VKKDFALTVESKKRPRKLASRELPAMNSRSSRQKILFTALLISGMTIAGLGDSPRAQAQTAAPTRPALTKGDRNDSVAELQGILRLLGYYNGAIDGVYQESTATAVSAFQRAAGLTADGVMGTATWNRLLPAASGTTLTTPTTPTTPTSPNPNTPTPQPTPIATNADFPVLRSGSRGLAVTRLQQRLRNLGFFTGVADGVFGGETEDAVRSAQRNFGLDADGIVGGATWDALLQ